MTTSGTFEAWLDRAGLSRLAPLFRANGIDLDVVMALNDGDLRELGLSLGDRKRVLAAIDADDPSAPKPVASATRVDSEAERRQLTILFADMVGSTALSYDLDPEDLREVMRIFRDEVTAAIEDAGGYVAKYMGDGVLAYFGYPQAQEDAAERAVRAGLALVTARHGAEGAQRRAVRVGIASGPVVIGDIFGAGLAREVNVVGETPNLAARLLGVAGPNQLIVSTTTRRLVGDLFQLKALAPLALKGIAGRVDAYEIYGDRTIVSRFEAARSARSSRLVGRCAEVDAMLERWQEAKTGHGRMLLLAGEAGIGKSRITEAFYERMADEPHFRIRYQCSPQHLDTPLYPVITQLRHAAGLAEGAPVTDAIDRLLEGADADALVLIRHLLGASLPDGSRFAGMDPDRRRQLTMQALVDQVSRLTTLLPVLFVVEDAHWIDPTTQALAGLGLKQAWNLRLLIVVTHRPEYQPPWADDAMASRIVLGRLAQDEVRGLLGGLARGKALPGEVVDHIVARTDGIPLYVEEMFWALLEGGILVETETGFRVEGALQDATVPATLQDSLMARLGHDDTAKSVANVGAVIGREFGHDLLAAIAGMEEANLRRGLEHLIDAGLVNMRDTSPEATYVFRHALVQEAAYVSQLRSRRQQLHAAIVGHIEKSGSALAQAQPEWMAYHCARAGLVARASAYRVAAGRRSLARSALVETVRTMRSAIGDLAAMPDDAVRWRFELEMLEIQRQAVTQSEGRHAASLERLAESMIALAQRLGDTESLISSLDSLASWHGWRAKFDRAFEFAGALLQLDAPRAQAIGNMQAGWILGYLGEPERAIQSYDRVLELELDTTNRALASVRMNALVFRAIARQITGHPSRGAADSQAAMALARQIGDPYLLGNVLWMQSVFHVMRRDDAAALSVLEELTPLAAENGFNTWFMLSRASLACVLCRQGRIAEGLAMIRMGLVHLEPFARDGVAVYTMLLMWAAMCLEIGGEIDAALGLIAKALDAGEQSKERWLFAELHRLRGDWLLSHRRGTAVEAERCYASAIDIARGQRARLFELRASLGLARLRRDQNRPAEAHGLLAPVYAAFSDGAETADLADARALLDELPEAGGAAGLQDDGTASTI